MRAPATTEPDTGVLFDTPECPLCETPGHDTLWHTDRLRVIRVTDSHWPGFTRVIWNSHVAEMTDLSAHEQAHIMSVVFTVEAVQRAVLQPHKINLAQLGNMVPHVHWHIIPRWESDPCFPGSPWTPATAYNNDQATRWETLRRHILAQQGTYEAALIEALNTLPNA